MDEVGGEIILEEEEETSQDKDATIVAWMLLVEDKIITQVIQVVTSSINKKFNVIIGTNLVSMHMNAQRSSMSKEGKSRFIRQTPTLCQAQC